MPGDLERCDIRTVPMIALCGMQAAPASDVQATPERALLGVSPPIAQLITSGPEADTSGAQQASAMTSKRVS